MHRSIRANLKRAVTRSVIVAVVIIVILILVISGFAALYLTKPSTNTVVSTSSTSPSSSSSSSQTSSSLSSTSSIASTSSISSSSSTASTTGGGVPSTLTWETYLTPQYLDPQVAYSPYDSTIYENVYETLLWYNGSSSTDVIPWLAQNYTISSDGKTASFFLRNGIKFADGEPLNSTAVYFTFNRLMIEDGSSSVAHGTQASWILFQFANKSLSWTLAGPHSYTTRWANEVLAQNFVQITSPLSFTLNIQNPNAVLKYALSTLWGQAIVAPVFVMQHDLALWSQTSLGYTLPYAKLTGNETNMITQYLLDEVATCDKGITPHGCATTYLDGSYQGSLAGTGPYTLKSVGQATNDIVLQARSDYWGGPYSTKFYPQIQTIDVNFVSSQATREVDLQNAVRSGQALSIDVTGDHLYDVADRNQWLNNNTLVSITPGVSLYGPYTSFTTIFDPFDTNVTNPQTGTYYTFQPFADVRLRLAFADAVNMTAINRDINNNLGKVAINIMPPGLPPQGTYNTSIIPRYSFNLSAVQSLMLSAMMSPLTSFHLENGTSAPQGLFNNTFGCSSLNSKGVCDNPVPQTIPIVFYTGDTFNQALMTQIASAINNVSATYNMGLTVVVEPVPYGQVITEGFAGQLYFWVGGWLADYPWSVDFLGPILAPGQFFTGPGGWNLTQMAIWFNQALKAQTLNNLTGLVAISNAMDALANQEVMYLYTIYPETFYVYTSNIHGFFYNGADYGIYFAAMY